MRLLTYLLVFISVSSSAEIIPEMFESSPPFYCVYGAVSPAKVGLESNCDGYNSDCSTDASFDFDYLKAIAPKHIVIGDSVSIKGDGAFYFSSDDNVYFYDSLGGYRGKDKSNTEGNAYRSYIVNHVGTHHNGPHMGKV